MKAKYPRKGDKVNWFGRTGTIQRIHWGNADVLFRPTGSGLRCEKREMICADMEWLVEEHIWQARQF